MASISTTVTAAAPSTTTLNIAASLDLSTANRAAASTQAISAYIISLVMARSIE